MHTETINKKAKNNWTGFEKSTLLINENKAIINKIIRGVTKETYLKCEG